MGVTFAWIRVNTEKGCRPHRVACISTQALRDEKSVMMYLRVPMKPLWLVLLSVCVAVVLALLPSVPVLSDVSGQTCSPAYPDICIAPPPPDLDCQDITHRNFRVLPPDPHRFDADQDGIGCEQSS